MAGDLAVWAQDIHKTYRTSSVSTPVLGGVDLAIPAGQCAFLAGPSGSGKTTLLSILGCILSADSGTIRVLGHDLMRLDEDGRIAMRRNHIGFVFQRFHLIRGLTVLDNVCVPLTLRGVPMPQAQERARRLIEAVGLAEKVHAHPRSLSAGQCQRVAIARALVGEPKIILADEPTASLDAANGQEVMALFRKLTAEEGKTAVVVTHDQRIFPFADRVFHLENGHVVQTGQPNALVHV
ncbi:MAG: ABC transporter ATP-binding protein [Pirellulales bacterium]|nr:ABC transporter ATP-binding protein [Pirellulales bacterium]